MIVYCVIQDILRQKRNLRWQIALNVQKPNIWFWCLLITMIYTHTHTIPLNWKNLVAKYFKSLIGIGETPNETRKNDNDTLQLSAIACVFSSVSLWVFWNVFLWTQQERNYVGSHIDSDPFCFILVQTDSWLLLFLSLWLLLLQLLFGIIAMAVVCVTMCDDLDFSNWNDHDDYTGIYYMSVYQWKKKTIPKISIIIFGWRMYASGNLITIR